MRSVWESKRNSVLHTLTTRGRRKQKDRDIDRKPQSIRNFTKTRSFFNIAYEAWCRRFSSQENISLHIIFEVGCISIENKILRKIFKSKSCGLWRRVVMW